LRAPSGFAVPIGALTMTHDATPAAHVDDGSADAKTYLATPYSPDTLAAAAAAALAPEPAPRPPAAPTAVSCSMDRRYRGVQPSGRISGGVETSHRARSPA